MGNACSSQRAAHTHEVIEYEPNHFCVSQDEPDAVYLSQNLPYYTPQYSPHPAAPKFYDVSGLTENPVAFRKVIDIFVNRYKAAGENGPTAIAGFDARSVYMECRLVCTCLMKADARRALSRFMSVYICHLKYMYTEIVGSRSSILICY